MGAEDNRIGATPLRREGIERVQSQIRVELEKVAPLAAAERESWVEAQKERKVILREQITKKKHAKCLLLALPWPLILRILDFAVDRLSSAVYLQGRNGRKATGFPLPSIAHVGSKRLRHAAIITFLEKSCVEIHSDVANQKVGRFLQNIVFADSAAKTSGETNYTFGFDAIKILNFPFFSKFPHESLGPSAFNQDIMLARMCKNLTLLSITWADTEVAYQVQGDMFPHPIEKLRRQYRLDGLFHLKKLELLLLRTKTTNWVYELGGHIGHRQVSALKEWFEDEFEKRGMKLDVR